MTKFIPKEKTLFLVGGYPGTGKSFIASKILEHASFVYIDKDQIDDVFSTSRTSDEYLKYKPYVWPMIYNAILIPNLEIGNSVLLDAPLSRKYLGNVEWINFIHSLSKEYNFSIKMVWCVASNQTRAERIKSRNHPRDQERYDSLAEFIGKVTTFDIPFDHIVFDTEYDDFGKVLDFVEKLK